MHWERIAGGGRIIPDSRRIFPGNAEPQLGSIGQSNFRGSAALPAKAYSLVCEKQVQRGLLDALRPGAACPATGSAAPVVPQVSEERVKNLKLQGRAGNRRSKLHACGRKGREITGNRHVQ